MHVESSHHSPPCDEYGSDPGAQSDGGEAMSSAAAGDANSAASAASRSVRVIVFKRPSWCQSEAGSTSMYERSAELESAASDSMRGSSVAIQ